MCSTDIFLGVLAILFPPLPVWVKRGLCSADSIINILLLLLGYLPGLIHAWYIIAKFPDDEYYEYDAVAQGDYEGGRGGSRHHGGERVRYIIIDRANIHNAKPQQTPNYGTQGGRSNQPQQQQPQRSAAASSARRPAPQEQGVTPGNAGSSSDGAVPPSYAEVVAGDHKIQTRD